MKLHKSTTTKAILLAIAAVVAAIACSPTTRIAYHRWRLESIHKATFSQPSVTVNGLAGFGSGDAFERLDYHRDRLVELGSLFHTTYVLEPSEDNQWAFSDSLQATYGTGYPLLPWCEFDNETVNVWDHADKQSAWDRFFHSVNREGWDAAPQAP